MAAHIQLGRRSLFMATKQQENSRRSDVIRCEFCGEDYSVTYRHCPFCDDMAGSAAGGRTAGRGGKRVAPTNKRGGGYGGAIQPVQIIGIALSVILIIAAIYIVYTVISPLLGGGKDPAHSQSGVQSSVSQSQPDASQSQPDASASQPDVSQPDPGVSTPQVPDPSTSSGVVTPIVSATGITLDKADVTLAPNEICRLKATVTPADSDDAVVWTSSNEAAAKVAADGSVTNVHTGSGQVQVTITAKAGNVTATCVVRCRPGSTGSGESTGTGSGNPGSTGSATAISGTGVVTGTSTGLFVRKGPGSNYEAQDTAENGAELTLLEDTGTGWYKVSYTGLGGKTTTGYVSKDYIKVK